LIKERDSLNQTLLQKQKELKTVERNKSDTIMGFDREIEDRKEVVKNFESTMAERKETIVELIKSVDDSLDRFNKINKEK